MIELGFLRWDDLDPAAHPWDPQNARAAVEQLVGEAASVPSSKRDLGALELALDRAFAIAHGAWSGGWRWAATEPGGGGPVRGYCCARDSLFRGGEKAGETTARVLAAMADWRLYLEECAALFAGLRTETYDLAIARAVERAAARILPLVVGRTNGEDAWYATFATTLVWYLESAGYDRARVRDVVHAVTRGRFESWIVPADDVAALAYVELGERVNDLEVMRAPEPRDALAEWMGIRFSAFANLPEPRAMSAVRVDGHDVFVERLDRARDPVRAERMSAALVLARDTARRGVPLTFDQLAECQAIVLGRPVALRAGDAFAKGGRDRYALLPDLADRFTAALADANQRSTEVTLRAARVYLDVCFFHPFDDGNARAARIALDYVLTAAGLALHAADPLFVIGRDAGDARGAWAFAYALGQLAGTAH